MENPDKDKILDNIQSSLILPFEFETNALEWHTELAEQFRKSTIGSVIIMIIGTLICVLFGAGIVVLALAAVMVMFFISQLKKRQELSVLADHKFILSNDSLTDNSPSSDSKTMALSDIKQVLLFRWGLQVQKELKESKEDILIPVSVPQFEELVKYFDNLGLLERN